MDKRAWQITIIIREADEEQAKEIAAAVRRIIASLDGPVMGGQIIKVSVEGKFVEQEGV